jgi:TetR/AcrR family transcriptional regulator, mexCD-oprJ operon repressor
VIADARDTLDAVDVSGDPRDALARLVGSSWLVVDRLRLVLAAAQRVSCPPSASTRRTSGYSTAFSR